MKGEVPLSQGLRAHPRHGPVGGWTAWMGCPMDESAVFLQVPDNLEPELEQQIRTYVRMREIGEQLAERGLLDPTTLT